jgi:pyocin large subunit-like protein
VAIVARQFANDIERRDHYKRHKADFPRAGSAVEYERLAVAFLNAEPDAAIMDHERRNGDRVRYHVLTDQFAVVRWDGIIKTYFIAKVSIHGCSSNLDYFYQECMK